MLLEVITGVVAIAVPENRMSLPPEPCQKEFSPPVLLYSVNPSSSHNPVHVIGRMEAGKVTFEHRLEGLRKWAISIPRGKDSQAEELGNANSETKLYL